VVIYSYMESNIGWALLLIGAIGLGILFPWLWFAYAAIIGLAFIAG